MLVSSWHWGLMFIQKALKKEGKGDILKVRCGLSSSIYQIYKSDDVFGSGAAYYSENSANAPL